MSEREPGRETQIDRLEKKPSRLDLAAEAVVSQWLAEASGPLQKKTEKAPDEPFPKYRLSLRRNAEAAMKGIDPTAEPYISDDISQESAIEPIPEIRSDAYISNPG